MLSRKESLTSVEQVQQMWSMSLTNRQLVDLYSNCAARVKSGREAAVRLLQAMLVNCKDMKLQRCKLERDLQLLGCLLILHIIGCLLSGYNMHLYFLMHLKSSSLHVWTCILAVQVSTC